MKQGCAIGIDETEIGESRDQARVRIARAGILPAHRTTGFRTRLPGEVTGAEHVDEEVEAIRWQAPHLIASHKSQISGAIAGLFEELAAGRILDPLAPLDVPSGQDPGTGEWSAMLFDDEDLAARIDAGDDRADGRILGHPGYGLLVLVGRGVGVEPKKGVGVGVGNPKNGVGEGDGVGDGVGQGSGLTRFQVYRPYVCRPAIASRIHWSVYRWKAAGAWVSWILIATFRDPSGSWHPATNQSSVLAGSVPLMNHSVVENGVRLDGRRPEPYPPNAPGAETTVPLTTLDGRCQSDGGVSVSASFM